MVTSLGFSGTRADLTYHQKLHIINELEKIYRRWILYSSPSEFHHGDCVGADDYAAKIASTLNFVIIAHPSRLENYRAYSTINDHVYLPKEPIARNHDIVDASTILLAAPHTATEQVRSGTWATIRYARQLAREIHIINPDGSIVRENGR